MKISAVGLGWYERDDYPRILQVMADAEKLPRTFDEWQKLAERTERETQAKGVRVVRAVIKSDDFVAWCRERGLKVDAQARMRFGNEAAYRAVKPD